MKIYVRKEKSKDSDGEPLITILTYKSKPKYYSYIIFV